MGQIELTISLGKEPTWKIVMAMFIVVNASTYTIILSHSTLNSFQVVVSPYYQKIKLPMRPKVGEVKEINRLLGDSMWRLSMLTREGLAQEPIKASWMNRR